MDVSEEDSREDVREDHSHLVNKYQHMVSFSSFSDKCLVTKSTAFSFWG